MAFKRKVCENYVFGNGRVNKGVELLDTISRKFDDGVVNFVNVNLGPPPGFNRVGADSYDRSYVATLKSDREDEIDLGVSWTDRKGVGGYRPTDISATLSYFKGVNESDLGQIRQTLEKVGFSRK